VRFDVATWSNLKANKQSKNWSKDSMSDFFKEMNLTEYLMGMNILRGFGVELGITS
jgi:hypothetical protein